MNHDDLLDSFDDGNDDLLASVVIEGEKTSNTSSAVEGNLVFKIRFEMPQLNIFSSPGQSPGRAIVLPMVSALASASALAKC